MSQPQQKQKERTNFFLNFMTPACNLDAFASISQRSLEALTTANEAIAEGAQAIAKRQAEVVKSGTESALQFFQDICSPNASETHFGKHVEFSRLAVEDAMANMDEMVKIITKSSTEAVGAITDCMTFAFTEACSAAQNKGSAGNAGSKKPKQQEAA